MSAVVVVGAQWGDEGKGKVVDLLGESADLVVRYAGGPNAGHTLVVGNDKVVVRHIPSGILQPRTVCAMAQGMVIDPAALIVELDALTARGVETEGRLFVSELVHLIQPYHLLIDALRESAAADRKIGTTKKGIGPTYEDKVARRGIRLCDLRDRERMHRIVSSALAAWAPVAAALGGELPDVDSVIVALERHAERLLPLAADVSRMVDASIRRGDRVLLEGAQGTMLDVDHGTYPYVTSSSAVAGGASTGVGIGPNRIDRVIGLTKAYCTRVGEGPFPTELHDELGERIRQRGGEFGSVTGRPRRTGWIDLPALRYAALVNGVDGWAITKLDVLTGLDSVQVCTAYDLPEGRTRDLPISRIAEARPVYETLPGWTEEIGAVTSLDDLPARARDVVRIIEKETEVPAFVVSVGPRRDQTIVLRGTFD